MTAKTQIPTRAPRRSTWGVVALCGLLILADGYDLIVFGNVVPALLAEPGWNLTPVTAGQIASLALVGMLIGALLAGTIADRLGRRRLIVFSLAWFSLFMALCAIAPTVTLFALFRGLGGLGLGALFPVVTALILEFAPAGKRALAYSFTLFGYLAGGVVAGALGLAVIPAFGWRAMFWIGAIPLLLVPVVIALLPESPAWLAARGRIDAARGIAERFGLAFDASPTDAPKNTVAAIFREGRAPRTLFAWGVQFCSLLLVFGMVNWLPTIMVNLGFNIQSALVFAIVLNVGAAIGAIVGSRIADRGAGAIVVVVLFLLGAGSIIALALSAQLALMLLLVALAGAGTLGTQILVNVLVGSLYPPEMRATGLGWALAVGRLGAILGPIIGGAIVGSGLPPQASFYFFAGVGALGAILTIPFLFWSRSASRSAAPVTA